MKSFLLGLLRQLYNQCHKPKPSAQAQSELLEAHVVEELETTEEPLI